MKLYEYFCLEPYGNSSYLTVTCTHPATLETIVSEVRKYLQSPGVAETKDISGQTLTLQFSSLNGRDGEIFLWIIKWLCQNGWEPYAVAANLTGGETGARFRNNTTGVHYFRKERDG